MIQQENSEKEVKFENPAQKAKAKRLIAEERIFKGSYLPRQYKEVVAYLEKTYGISQKVARRDIEILILTGVLEREKEILKLKDGLSPSL